MKALITGGLGFIGSRVAIALLKHGDKVRALDNLNPQIHRDDRAVTGLKAHGADVVLGDVRNAAELRRSLRGVDVVFHLAAETGTGQSMSEIRRYTDTNVGGTANLCEALPQFEQVRAVVLASSRAVYGEGAYRCADHGLFFASRRHRGDLRSGAFGIICAVCGSEAAPQATCEVAELRPASVYASTKMMQELLLSQVCDQLGIALQIPRLQNVYGPGQALHNPYQGFLSVMIRQIHHGRPLELYEDGGITRDFVFIDDVVDVMVEMASREALGTTNIGRGEPVDLFGVVSAFEAAFGRRIEFYVSGRAVNGYIRHAVAETTKMTRVLGPRALLSFEDGLRALVGWASSVEPAELNPR